MCRATRWWFEVGQQTLLLHPEPPPGAKRSYRKKTIEKSARRLSKDKLKQVTNVLWLARKLAQRFTTWKKLEKFQGKLSVWHVLSLLSVDLKRGSESSMNELRDRCVSDRLSVDQLKREIQNDRGGKASCGRLPIPLKAATPDMAVKDLYISARRWNIYHKQCLAGRHPILKQKRDRRTNYSSNQLRDVKKAISEMEQVQEAVKEELQQLRQLAKKIKAALRE